MVNVTYIRTSTLQNLSHLNMFDHMIGGQKGEGIVALLQRTSRRGLLSALETKCWINSSRGIMV